MPRNLDPKVQAIFFKTPTWGPFDSGRRARQGLDGATGKLTIQQQRVYADLPDEEWSRQPSTSHKILFDASGGVEYTGLVPNGDRWSRMPSGGPIITQAIGRA